ncbi:TPA: hypothetical protein O4E67_001283 [Staphylococcus aureus]|nr:hypothetical protein [Staphylococcus aureus]
MNIGKKDVLWGYLSLGMVHGINLLLLPVILKFLKINEIGLWYTFTSLYGMAMLIDFGFQTVIGRNISYLWAGSSEIKKASYKNNKLSFDITYFIKVLSTVKFIYFCMGLIVFIFLSTIGTIYVIEISKAEIEIHSALTAYFIYMTSIILNISFSYWNALLKGIGAIKSYNQILILTKAIQLILSILFLFLGMGIVGMSLAYLISVIVNRIAQSKIYYNFSPDTYNTQKQIKISYNKEIFMAMLPNTMKTGILSFTNYLIINFPIILSSYYLSLEMSGRFGLFNQILTIIITISNSYFNTYLSKINYLRVKNQYYEIVGIFKKAMMTNYIFNITAFVLLLFMGGYILELINKNYELIPIIPMILVIIYRFLYNNQGLFTTFLTTKNSIPHYIHFLVSAIVTIIVQVILLEFVDNSLINLILPLLFVQLFFNNWYWVYYVIKDIIKDKESYDNEIN